MALAGRDFEPGEVSRRRRSERGPHREPVNVELPRSEAVQAESSVESLGDALEPLEARYLTQCRARLLGPVRMVYPERGGLRRGRADAFRRGEISRYRARGAAEGRRCVVGGRGLRRDLKCLCRVC